jgi:diacylglycerol kinase (ATP)
MELAVIVNPRAGRRTAVWKEPALRAALGPLGIGVSVHVTRAPGDARRLAKELAGRADVIGVVGGDGTVHEVVNGIVPHRVPIVLIPSGAGNDLASLIACPGNLRELAAVIENGWGAELDILNFGDRFCVNSAGLGFEGLVNRMSHDLARIGGRTRYALALLRALRSFQHPHFKITTSRGDEVSGEMLLVSIGNGRRTGGAFYLTPHAFPDDGLIDVCIIEPMSRAKMLFILPRALNGSHVARKEVRLLRVASLAVEATAAYPMHIDGEYVDAGPQRREITVVPGALRILCRPSRANILSKELKKIL